MNVLIVIPTVTGREAQLELCKDAYKETCPDGKQLIIKDKNTCGEVWNQGARYARKNWFDYIHMTADDLIPHPGWYEAAVETIEAGYLPGALIYRPDGSLETFGNQIQEEWTQLDGGSVPFCRTKDWIDIPNIHYFSDNAYDYAQQYKNAKTFRARKNYAFTHFTASQGRKELTDTERKIFEDWKETL